MPKQNQLSDFTRIFERHTEEDGKNFVMIRDEQRASEERLEAKIAKKLDKAVFTMFLTIAMPVFGWLVWYMIVESKETQVVLTQQAQENYLTNIKVEKIGTDVSWIKSVFEKYDIVVK